MLGIAHIQRIRTPDDGFEGDIRRLRRVSKTRTYLQYFYLLRAEEPYEIIAMSTEFCVGFSGAFSRPWRAYLAKFGLTLS